MSIVSSRFSVLLEQGEGNKGTKSKAKDNAKKKQKQKKVKESSVVANNAWSQEEVVSQENKPIASFPTSPKSTISDQQHQHRNLNSGTCLTTMNSSHNGGVSAQWDDRQVKDFETSDEVYQKELENAILQSKLEQEQALIKAAQLQQQEQQKRTNSTKQQKSSNQNKTTVGLAEHSVMGATTTTSHFPPSSVTNSSNEAHHTNHNQLSLPFSSSTHNNSRANNSNSVNKLSTDVHSRSKEIIQNEKMKEEYQMCQKVDAGLQQKYDAKLEAKENEIRALSAQCTRLQEQIKLQNSDLESKALEITCLKNVMNDAQIKSKAQLSRDIAALTEEREEFITQINQLNDDLERERGRSRQFKDTLEKCQMSGGVSFSGGSQGSKSGH